MNDGIAEVVRTAEMMVEVELDAMVRLERRDAASVVQGSVRGMIRGLGLVRSKGAEREWKGISDRRQEDTVSNYPGLPGLDYEDDSRVRVNDSYYCKRAMGRGRSWT
jgi:hypothetical protein